MTLQSEWRDRLKYWTHALTQDFYHPLGDIGFEGFATFEQLEQAQAQQQAFAPMPAGTSWGREWQYLWLRSSITLPPQARDKLVVLDLRMGGEATLFVDGRAFGTKRAEWVTVPHHYIQDNILSQAGEPGRRYELLIEAYAGHYFPEGVLADVGVGPVFPGAFADPLKDRDRQCVEQSTYGVWNEEAYQLWLDVTALTEIMENLSAGSLRAAKIARGLREFTLAVDFEQPLEGRLRDYERGRAILRPLLEAKNGSTAPTFYGIGNSHLDVVWLWPLQETVRKTARTFAQQLRLLERYPDYKYLQSQPQTYQMCQEHYPELYERVKQAIREGRWIAEGGMWVEPDTNMSSGESLIRQLLYGMRFFKEELGVDCEILWLPDTFGYSAVLPQILGSFGIKYLVTQKIFWSYNEGERFPYHYFTWRGNDGSEIISYLPTSYTYRTNPQELMQLWENRVQKDDMDKFLLPFGYGDGGGGPTRDYMEYAGRQADLEGAPRFRMAHPVQLFRDLEAAGGPVHRYTGELYFDAHRGVYTSQARVKRDNRRGEFALREAELWSAIAAREAGGAYPTEELEQAWKKVLLNQFHDILPGSSIGRVYEEAAVVHGEAISTADELAQTARLAIAGAGESAAVFNSLSWPRSAVVSLPQAFARGARTAEGEAVPVENTADGVRALVSLPSCGYTVLLPADEASPVEYPATVVLEKGCAVLENNRVRAAFNAGGELVSYRRKDSGREYAAGPMNRFLLYKDVPRKFDAWDIDSPYELQPVELEDRAEIAIASVSPLCASFSMQKKIGNSLLRQTVSLAADSDVVTFATEVDWRELHRLLKVSFPVDVHTTEAVNEIQFGYVKRPNHRSRQYDKDRFEVCNHKYTALCDEGHGAAVLNDCKYGVSMLDNAVSLTLLRAAGSPELRADNGVHHFTYAFTGWEGPFAQCDVVRRGYELNVPPTVAKGGKSSRSFLSVDAPNVVVEAAKLAEDGSGDLILRLYEAKGADTHARLRCGLNTASAALCRMSEERLEDLPVEAAGLPVHFTPFQIHTVRLSR